VDYTPITTEKAIDAVLKGERLEGREIPDLRALIEGIQKEASDPDTVSLECENCRILKCQCGGLDITFDVAFNATFRMHADFREATFRGRAEFRQATFREYAHFCQGTFREMVIFDGATFKENAYFDRATFAKNVIFIGATFTENADFDGATFRDVTMFSEAKFAKNANFSGATFAKDADFSAATFTKCTGFARATFKGTVGFAGATFTDVTIFWDARFTKNVDFFGATFTKNADFRGAKFTKDSVLTGNFAEVNFTDANFNKCFLRRRANGANLDRANLEHTRGLILDSTPIRNARFSPRASDPWSRLRRAYTGPRLVFTLMFLVAFFTPYVLKTAGWVSVNRVQEELKHHVEEITERVKTLESEEHPAARPLTVALEAVADRLPQDNDDRWQTRSVWELVIGMDKNWTYWVTAIVLLAYNLCRAGLTWFVAPMRDAEERSGVSPAYRRDTSNRPKSGDGWEVATWPVRWILWWIGTLTDSYGWVIWPHRFARVVFVLAFISFCWHALGWLQLPVTLPAQPTVLG